MSIPNSVFSARKTMAKRKAEEAQEAEDDPTCRKCPGKASFGLPNGNPTHCGKCRTNKMVNLVAKRCSFEGCFNRPTHGLPGTLATHCETHKSSEMHRTTLADHPVSSMWDFERNELGPESFSTMSGKKAWFMCNNPNCHCLDRAFQAIISNVTSCGSRCPRCNGMNNCLCALPECTWCHGRSFASHPKAAFIVECLDGKQAREVGMSSHSRFLFRCDACSPSHRFVMSPNKIDHAGNWCPYCGGNKLCSEDCSFCFSKSLASNPQAVARWSPNNGEITPRGVRLNARAKYIFRCEKCTSESGGIIHESMMSPNCITSQGRMMCNYCARKQLCDNSACMLCFGHSLASHKDIGLWDSAKNDTLTPRNIFLFSTQKAWFTCKYGHDFEVRISEFTAGNRCGRCTRQTEETVYSFLQSKYPAIQRHVVIQRNPHRIMDMAIGKVIVEIDGRQHFHPVSGWANSGKVVLERDAEKMKLALTQGYRIVRVYQPDVCCDRIDWKEQLMEAVERGTDPVIYLSHDSGIYDTHRAAMQTTDKE